MQRSKLDAIPFNECHWVASQSKREKHERRDYEGARGGSQRHGGHRLLAVGTGPRPPGPDPDPRPAAGPAGATSRPTPTTSGVTAAPPAERPSPTRVAR